MCGTGWEVLLLDITKNASKCSTSRTTNDIMFDPSYIEVQQLVNHTETNQQKMYLPCHLSDALYMFDIKWNHA